MKTSNIGNDNIIIYSFVWSVILDIYILSDVVKRNRKATTTK